MQKRFLLIVCGLVLAGLLALPAGAATFEPVNENLIAASFQSHTSDQTYSADRSASQYKICINNIQYWANSKPEIVLALCDYGDFTVSNTSIPSGSASFTLYISTDIVSTGTINYNILYDSEDNPSRINVWLEFNENFDIHSYTGTQYGSVSYTSGDINGLTYYNGRTANLISELTEDWQIVYCIKYVSGGYYSKPGNYIVNEDYYWKNNIQITPDNPETASVFTVNIDREESYLSLVKVYTDSTDYIDDYSLNDINIGIYQYPIYIDIQDTTGTWYNRTYYDLERTYWTLTLDNDEPNKYEIIHATLEEESGAPALVDIIYYQQPSSYQTPIYGNYDEDHIYVQYRQTGGNWFKFNTSSSAFDIPVSEADAYTWETKFYSTGSFNAVAYLVSASPPPVTLRVPVTVTEEEVEEGIITFRPYDASTGAALWCQYELYDHTADDLYSGGGTIHSALVPIGHSYTYNAYLVNYQNATWSGIFVEDGEEHVVYLHRSTSAGGAEAEVEIVAVNEEGLVIGSTVFQVSNSTWSKTKIGEYVRFTVLQNHEYTWKASKSGYGSATGTFNLTSDYEYIEASLTGTGVTATPIPTTGLAGSGSGLDVSEESRQSVREALTLAFDFAPQLFIFFLLLLFMAAIKKV